MSDWRTILDEIQDSENTHDSVRRKYLRELHNETERNVIIYYSGWQQIPSQRLHPTLTINDADKNGFMAAVHGLDQDLGLDLVLHTPGGSMAATEGLVNYLHKIFGGDIRAIVPQIAMSGGTMIACASKRIIMGKQSSLGPIDPQVNGVPADAILEEWETAKEEIREHPELAAAWRPILRDYGPTFVDRCRKASEWADQIVEQWLRDNMLDGDSQADEKIGKIKEQLGDPDETKSHRRQIALDEAAQMGLDIYPLEKKQSLQDSVLAVHHATIQTLSEKGVDKIIENHDGAAHVSQITA